MSFPGNLFNFSVAALSFFAASSANASPIYTVLVNTSAISGTSGNIDLEFNPGPLAQSATATISMFSSTGGSLGGAAMTTGDVSGALPGSVTINNTAGAFPNDYFQPFTFGTAFQFQLSFTGPAITSPNGTATSGSLFTLSLFNADGTATLLTTEPNGYAGTAEVNLDGSVTTAVFPSGSNGQPPVVTFGAPFTTPEPSSLSLAFLPFLALAGSSIRRKLKS